MTFRQQRRKSSVALAQTISQEEPLFTKPVQPPVEIFPNSTSTRQENLIISPDFLKSDFTIIKASTCEQLLTVTTSTTSLSGQSHAKQFYGTLSANLKQKNGKHYEASNDTPKLRSSSSNLSSAITTTTSSDSKDTPPTQTKLFTLERDAFTLRRLHHVIDPYTGHRIMQIEFSPSSSWDAQALKADIQLLNKYSTNEPLEPQRLRWKGKKNSMEGVLEIHHKAVAVCAKGEETAESGDYILFVAPGMDLYVACCIVMAVDDRTRRSSSDGYKFGYGGTSPKPVGSGALGEGEIIWEKGYR